MPPIWAGFWAPKSQNKGPFFGKFSIKRVGYPEIGEKLQKMGGFPPKFIIKVGMTARLGN